MSAASVRAATLVEPGHYELREYPLPEPAPGCALVKMEVSGICGTDKHTYQGYTTQYAGSGSPKQIPFPIIQGHENVGTVAAIGPGSMLTDFEGVPLGVGDRVVVGPNVSCGKCYYCRHDFPYYFCENTTDYGNNLSAKDPPHLFGGWAEYMYLLPGTPLFRVPDSLPDEVAALTEVMAVTHGFDRARMLTAGWGGSAFGESVPQAAWKTIPSWYMVAQEDQALNPNLQRFFAKRIGAKTTEIKSSHVPFISHPAEVARLIEQAAMAADK